MTEDEVKYHIGLIHYVLRRNERRLGSYDIDEDEAFSAGLVGLAKAIHDYDEETCSVEFYKFAYHKIWNSIFTNRRRHDIRTGILGIKEAFFQKTGRHIRDDQLVKLLGADKKFPKLLRDHLRETKFLADYIDNDNKEKVFMDKNVPLPEEAGTLDNEFVAETVQAIINDRTILDDDERKVLKLYFGIGVSRCFILREIMKLLALTQKVTSECLKQGLEKLSANKRLKVLAEAEA